MQRQRDELVPVAEVLSDLPFLECDKGSYHTLNRKCSDIGAQQLIYTRDKYAK